MFKKQQKDSHPPTPGESGTNKEDRFHVHEKRPPTPNLPREEMRFLSDVATRPLSGTVSRYQRLNLSRRRGNAIRQSLVTAGLIDAVPIATRAGQVVLIQLTDVGRSVCVDVGIDLPSRLRASLEHAFWANKMADHFERQGYDVALEQVVKGNGVVDVVSECPRERVAIEIETGKSDIKANLTKLPGHGFDRVIIVATSPQAVSACQRAMIDTGAQKLARFELWSWLDVS